MPLNTGFPDNYFDIIICNHIYEHASNPRQLIAEIKGCLNQMVFAILPLKTG